MWTNPSPLAGTPPTAHSWTPPPTGSFPTAELTATGATSILGYDDVIDHILASDEIMRWYEPGSALVYRVDEHIPDYRETTSDHLPVLVRFSPGS